MGLDGSFWEAGAVCWTGLALLIILVSFVTSESSLWALLLPFTPWRARKKIYIKKSDCEKIIVFFCENKSWTDIGNKSWLENRFSDFKNLEGSKNYISKTM